ncbi:MAG: adenylosuccinate synthase [Oscillospiraceae bacterium]|jgi:adenylosuccinate synthase|nr:adenylosuccinate synthase [Oscillospiraceae bacterium]
MITSVVGVNWGDEGKGRTVDLLSGSADIVSRYQGGNNAGHTIVNNMGKFVLNLVPSGIFHPNVVNVLGGGMVVDIEHLFNEVNQLRARGVIISPVNLKISRRAAICMPWHRHADGAEEDRLGSAKQGSTRRGIGPVYADRALRKALRMEDLLDHAYLEMLTARLVDWKNITLAKPYGLPPYTLEGAMGWLREYGDPFLEYVIDADEYIDEAAEAGKNILLEAQLGTLRDLDYGIYPYTTSSSALAASAPIGAGIPARRLDKVIGVVKAFSSSVGGGPFVAKFEGGLGNRLREVGEEFGAATGRPRMVGAFDLVATKYGARLQGIDEIVLTKLDTLDFMDEIPVCTAYEIDGEQTDKFPTGARLERAKPVFETLPGWRTPTTECRSESDLPENARLYIDWIEERIRRPITTVSVGPSRDAYLNRVGKISSDKGARV